MILRRCVTDMTGYSEHMYSLLQYAWHCATISHVFIKKSYSSTFTRSQVNHNQSMQRHAQWGSVRWVCI